MSLPLSRDRLARHVLTLILATVTQGCGPALTPPENFATTAVSGRVLEGERPVGGGWIEFTPVEGAVGNIRSARLHLDGTFQVDKVAMGENALRLVNAPIQMPHGVQLFGQFATPIRRHITKTPAEVIQIDLMNELANHQARLPVHPRYELDFSTKDESEEPR